MWKIFRVLQKEWLIRDTKFRPSRSNVCVGNEKTVQENIPTFRGSHHCVPAVSCSKLLYRLSYERQRNTEEKGDYDQTEHDRDCNWENWTRSFQQDIWSSCHVLEAVGWGTAVVSGLHMSHLLYSSRHRQDNVNRCWLAHMQKMITTVIWQRYMEFETSYTFFSSAMKTMLPSGVFSSLPLLSSCMKIVSDKFSTKSVGIDAVMPSCWSRNDYQDVQVVKNGSVEVSGLKVCDAVKHIGSKQSPTKAESDFKDALTDWNGTLRMIEALSKNLEGINKASHGNMEEAIRLWRLAVELADCAQAHFNLALSYELGLGIKQDLEKALEHYQYAAEQNHPSSLFNSAMIHLRFQHDISNSKAKAMQLLEKAAEIGSREAQRELGVLYTELPERDMKRAACLFQKAAEQKDAKAMYFLGVCYENGWGVECSDIMAVQLYEKAAAAGHTDAQFNLRVFCESGKGGVLHDKMKAMEMHRMAADHSCIAAKQLMHNDTSDRKLLSDNGTESIVAGQQLCRIKSTLKQGYKCMTVGHHNDNFFSHISISGSWSVYSDLVSGSSSEHDIQNKSILIPGNHMVSLITGK